MSSGQERGRTGRGQVARATDSPPGPGKRGAASSTTPLDQPITTPEGIVKAPGTAGTPIELCTNYIEWSSKQPKAFGYHVTFMEPQVEQISTRRALVRKLRELNLLPEAFIYDGDANLKTLEELTMSNFPADVSHDGANYKIQMVPVGGISMGSPEMLRLYNTLSRSNLRKLGFAQIGRYYYDPKTEMQLNVQNVKLWFGMDTTVSSFEGDRQLMVLNSISKVVRGETAFDLMKKVRTANPDNWMKHVANALTNRTVLTEYNNRHYRIADVDFNKKATDTFPFTNRTTGATTEISYIDYVKQQYKRDVVTPGQPMLVVAISARDKRAGKTEPIYLIPELCMLTGIADLVADTSLRREMISATKKTPTQRVRDIRGFMGKCVANPDIKSEMQRWGLSFGSSLVTVPGRVLPAEKVTLEGGNSFIANEERDFDRAFKNIRMKEAPELKNWVVIHDGRDTEIVRNFLTLLNDASRRLGLILLRPTMVPLPSNRIHDYLGALQQAVGPDCQLVMPFLGRATENDKYAAIKKRCCVERPVPSQVIVANNVRDPKRSSSIAVKVAIQMNCKLGGVPWQLDMPPVNLMVVGYDAHHDTSLRKSVGAFVSSLNPEMTKWFSRVRYHDRLEELSPHFKANMKEALEAYKAAKGSYPAKVVVYRDGVSEGQLRYVHEVERMQIRDALEEVSPTDVIALSIVIVTKQVAARLFLKRNDEYFNPTPGTIADSVIQRATAYDFFLISQNVRDGTVGPVNYNIIHDTTGWTLTHHQRLAYKLCHLYFNWTGTVKVPCPCQYAHKLSFLVGTHIHAEPHPSLCDRLFFL